MAGAAVYATMQRIPLWRLLAISIVILRSARCSTYFIGFFPAALAICGDRGDARRSRFWLSTILPHAQLHAEAKPCYS